MANVLTDLAADIYKAADIVGREAVGFIPSVTINAGSEEAAQGDTVRAAFTRAATLNTSVTPAMTIPEGDDQTVDNKTLVLDQIANVQIPWTGEDVKHVNNGTGYETIYGDQIAQAFRAIVNGIESHVADVAYQGASRAVGTAATTPFGSDHDVIAEARQILFDNGMPVTDGRITLVLNSNAGTNMRNIANLQTVNTAGNDTLLRQGTLLDLQGAMVKESGQIGLHTNGTGTGYLLDDATSAIGDTALVLDTGSGTVVAGDVVTFAAETNKYVVNVGVAAPGTITIGGPGLRTALPDSNAMTIGGDHTPNVMLHQSAVELAMRPLETPNGGDAATDMLIVQDPHSGLVFQLSLYRGFKKSMLDITTLYKAKVWKSDGVAIVMG